MALNVITSSENKRIVETNGANINLTRRDPYGFWYVSFEKGETPSKLKGAYTTLSAAYTDIENYLTNHPRRSAATAATK